VRKTGFAELPLHRGHAPRWLFSRMVRLGRCILDALIDEEGPRAVLTRLADPCWFQAISCVLGYDWHSSGTTTVTCAALKAALRPEVHGVAAAGGKGRVAKKTPAEIEGIGKTFDWSAEQIDAMKYASKMSAKVDTAAIQAGYPLYHHAVIVDEAGGWTVIQQGMNPDDGTARRYHWLSDHVASFVVEPHDAIVGDRWKPRVLDMTAHASEGSRRATIDLINDGPERLRRRLLAPQTSGQRALSDWMDGQAGDSATPIRGLVMPRSINWTAVKTAYAFKPQSYEELLAFKGVGPATIRGLALIAEVLYGETPSWTDPVKFSFCVGGKDGVPFPVDKAAYDAIIGVMSTVVEQAKMGKVERVNALKRLRGLVPP
jgi:hypothetical protein